MAQSETSTNGHRQRRSIATAYPVARCSSRRATFTRRKTASSCSRKCPVWLPLAWTSPWKDGVDDPRTKRDEGCFPHDAEDKLQLGQQCFEDYNFTFSEIFSAAASLWPGERRGLSSVSRYRAVLASFTCPSSNCAALRSPVS
jgi:hypothetical protein